MTIGAVSNSYPYSFQINDKPYSIGENKDTNQKENSIQVDKDASKDSGKSNPEECETCKHRKYVDGSDESNVSFKSAAHISPSQANAKVRAHEGEHVANAYSDASTNNGEVISATVSIHTAVCPECGRTYVSGGTTSTQIKYYNESNPYQQDLKAQDATKYRGANVDITT